MAEIKNAKIRLDELAVELNVYDTKFFLNSMAPISQEDAAEQAFNWMSLSFQGLLPKAEFSEYDLPA